ncbi:hypothetical protein VaNZ11_004161, partial [Volvox africanus]
MASKKDSGSGGKEENGNSDAVTALTTNQLVLQYFWDMASYDENVRVTAARGLVKELTEEQLKYQEMLKKDTVAPPEEGTPKPKLLEYHLRRCSPTMVYTLRRLARGLSSSRQGARQGYATALTGLLAASRCLPPAGVLVLLDVCIDGPLKGGDAKDTLLGRLFGYAALLRSGISLEPSVQGAVFNSLLQCGQGKSFLRECAAAVALEAAERMDTEAIAAVVAPGQPLATMLAVKPADATPEALLLALVLWPKLPGSLLQTCRLLPANTPPPPPELFFGASAVRGGALSPAATAAAAVTAAGLFSREHLQLLTPALLATSGSHPRMHMLWQYLLPLLLPGFRPHRNMDLLDVPAEAAVWEPSPSAGATVANGSVDKKSAKAAAKAARAAKAAKAAEGKGAVNGLFLETFWSVVVEGGLMDSSHERRYLGFQLFSRVLPHLRPEHVPSVFSPAFTRTLVASVKRSDSYLHAGARKLLDGLSAFLERSDVANSSVKMAVAAALQRLGGLPMKQLTNSKITQKLVQGLDAEGVHRYVTSLMEAFLAGAAVMGSGAEDANGREKVHGEEEEEEAQDAERVVADRRGQCVEQLVAALKFPDAAQSDCEAALRFLALHAFAEVKPSHGKASQSNTAEVQQAAKHLTSHLSSATRTRCASRLVTLIAHLSHAAQSRPRAAQQQQQQQQPQQQQGANAGKNARDAATGLVEEADAQPAAKKRKTSSGAEATAAAGKSEPPLATLHQHLHDTLSFIRKALKAPGVSLAVELGDDGDNALQLLAAIETASLERLMHLEKGAPHSHGKPAGHGVNASAAVRSLATLAAHLQLQLLADPASFEMDLPLSLRRVAAEGLGVEGLPEVEEQSDKQDEDGDEVANGKPGAAGSSWNDVLVDVMLAVMAQPVGSVPTSPLREAAESLWRQCCAAVSADGLADVVRVVAAGGKGEGQSTAGLFESDEEEGEEPEDGENEEEGEEEDGEERAAQGKKGQKQGPVPMALRKRKKVVDKGSEGSDSENSDSDTEEEEEEEEALKGGGSGKKSSGDVSTRDDKDDESEDGDEGLDDEAMFRMDDKLAAYFRSLAGGRPGSTEAAERAAALLNFRLRALALLETFAKKVPNSPLLLTCLEPLLRALATASRPGAQPEMAKRLRGVIANKISKCRCRLDLACLGGLEGYASTLKRLLYEASRNRDKPVAAAAWQAYMAVLRAGAAAEAEEPGAATAAQSSFRAALSDLLTKKKTRLQIEELLAAFRAAPTACISSLDLLLQHVSSGRNATLRVAAAELLARLLKTKPDGLKAAVAAGGPGGVGGALGGAVAACVAAVGLKTKQHVRAVQAAVTVAESLKQLLQGKRLAEILGADKINAIAKAMVTVQSLGTVSRVDKLHRRLTDVMVLGSLLEKTKPDPALAARIQKARPDSVGAEGAGTAKGKKKGKAKEKGGGVDKEQGTNSAERKQGDVKAGKGKTQPQVEAKRRKGNNQNGKDDAEMVSDDRVSEDSEKADSDSGDLDSDSSSGPEEEPSSSGREGSDDLDEDSEGGKQAVG